MSIGQKHRDGCVVLTLIGNLDDVRGSAVRQAIEKALADQPRAVICELQRVPPATVNLNIFLVAADMANRWPETPVILVSNDRRLTERLRRLRITDRLAVHESLAEALGDLGRRPPVSLDTTHIARSPAPGRDARSFVQGACQRWQLEHLVTDAEIAVTELVNNAFEHTGDAAVVLRLNLSSRGLRISIGDRSPFAPPSAPARMRRGQLTGLGAVELVSSSWGVLPTTAGGKMVWCLLPSRNGSLAMGQ